MNRQTTSPQLLTKAEAVQYLQLDESGVRNPGRTLDRYRTQGQINGVRIGRSYLYRKNDLDAFIVSQKTGGQINE